MKLTKIALLFLFSSPAVFASNVTVLNDPHSVAPFNVCFTKNPDAPWPIEPVGVRKILFAAPEQHFPLCLNQNLTIAAYKKLTPFQKDFFVAVSLWQSYFISPHPVNINVVVDNHFPRFSGNANPGKIERKKLHNGQTVSVIYPSALSTMLGQKGSPVDIVVTIKVEPSANYKQMGAHCVDPNPTSMDFTCIPDRGRELTSVIIHELAHGYGIRSLRVRAETVSYGNFFQNRISSFDYATNNDATHNDLQKNYADYFANGQHDILFTGAQTVAYLKQIQQDPYLSICNIPKGERNHSQNFAHICGVDCANPPHDAQPLLMGRWCLWHGPSRLSIGSLDLHMMADIGYKPILKTMTEVQNLRKVLFNPNT